MDGRALAALGRNKTQSAGKKNMSGVLFGGVEEDCGKARASGGSKAPLYPSQRRDRQLSSHD